MCFFVGYKYEGVPAGFGMLWLSPSELKKKQVQKCTHVHAHRHIV